jgi:hypothetical protein
LTPPACQCAVQSASAATIAVALPHDHAGHDPTHAVGSCQLLDPIELITFCA